MKSHFLVGIAFALIFVLAFSAYFQQSAAQLYQSALYKEEVEGELQEAINIYEKIIKEYPESYPVAAKAQFHIGLCYEKLGLKEAQNAFQKVIDNYPKETEVVKMAREKLSLLLKAQTVIRKGDREFALRKIGPGIEEGFGAISPDGRYLTYVDWNTGDLAVLEMTTGKKRHLTDKGSWLKSGAMAFCSRWSPDGKQIAYDWWDWDREPNFVGIRIISLDSKEPQNLYQVSNPEKEITITYGWSPDGKSILMLLARADQASQVVLVSVADGSARTIKRLDLKRVRSNQMIHMLFSPDGRYIVYDWPAEDGSPNSDIYLISVDGREETTLVNHPADDILLGWTPDGKNLLFASNRRSTADAWLLRLEDGKPKETPELLMEGIGEIEPLGFTKEGSFYYSSSKSTQNVYIAKIDSETGKIKSPPKAPIQHFGKITHSPAYSTDGKHFAYISVRSSVGPKSSRQSILCIRSLDTGKEREIYPDLPDFWNLKWSSDSQQILSIAVDGRDRSAHSMLCVIDLKTGDVRPIVRCKDNRLNQWFQSYEWSPDGKSIFYVRNDKPKKLCQLLLHDLESGREEELYRAPTWAERFTISISPDGKWLALINYKGLEKKERSLKIIPAIGGEPRLLHAFEQESNWAVFTAWTPDSKFILFSKKADKENDIRTDLWRIPVEGGEPQRLGLTMARFNFLSMHPNGGSIAFSSFGPTLKEAELWVMKNLVPKGKNNE